ncbi:MAG TPA: vanadium-dependent haloperoxidase [Verrucomicrobiae bacterium]|nr:vanadium-dependent haloperoxidase [Verrucomicrobiae bacterium]
MRRKACRVQTLVAAGLVLAGLTTVSPAAHADAVVDWNIIASQAVATAARAGGSAGLDFATVHAAIHDAVQGYDGRFEPYAIAIQGATGSPVAATASAAHDVLVNRFPAQAASLDTAYHSYLANNGLAEDDPGVSVGQMAAAAIIALRANDGSYPANPERFVGGTAPGEWRPTPPAFAPMAVPWLGSVTPFTIKDPTQFGAPPPPELNSGRYTQDYNEVKAMGALVDSGRTPEQTDLAYFYADNAFFYWNRALQGLANAHLNNLGDSARLFALCSLVMADAPIVIWYDKKYYNFWRPVTAIQEGDNDGNPKTAGDPAWLPLFATPPYPEYTSGANSLSGSVTRMLEKFFGTDEVTFSITSNFPLAIQKTRTYSRFSDAAQDVVDARVLLGIHFRTADEVSRRQGRQVADWAFTHALRPLTEGDN